MLNLLIKLPLACSSYVCMCVLSVFTGGCELNVFKVQRHSNYLNFIYKYSYWHHWTPAMMNLHNLNMLLIFQKITKCFFFFFFHLCCTCTNKADIWTYVITVFSLTDFMYLFVSSLCIPFCHSYWNENVQRMISFYLYQQPPSSTYYSTVPGDMTASRMSNSTFSPTYDDPARSDEESDQYGGSTYSGGGPYARAIDSVSQSGTAKRLSKSMTFFFFFFLFYHLF